MNASVVASRPRRRQQEPQERPDPDPGCPSPTSASTCRTAGGFVLAPCLAAVRRRRPAGFVDAGLCFEQAHKAAAARFVSYRREEASLPLALTASIRRLRLDHALVPPAHGSAKARGLARLQPRGPPSSTSWAEAHDCFFLIEFRKR